MMNNNQRKNRKSTRGATLVEFALTVPLLILLCMAAGDFARLFFHAVTVANAAGTGAVWGARDTIKAGDFAGMAQRARDDAGDLDLAGVTATGGQLCQCPPTGGNAYGDPRNCSTLLDADQQCSGEKARSYARVSVGETFETLGPYPGIPRNTLVGRTALIRVD